jgi:hypothetical protein
MTTIPQELIEAILADFDPEEDRKTLKSISLTATSFVGPVQRLVFRALALQGHSISGWYPTFERMLNLLDASPHIASYVKDLAIRLPPKISTEYHILLERLLPKFSDVRRFIVKGFGVSWDNLQPGLQLILSAFLLRASLDRLHLIQILAMPGAIMTAVAQTIKVLSVQTVTIKGGDDMEAAEASSPVTPRLTHLIVSSHRGVQSKALQEVILSAYTPNLRRLAIDESDFSRNVLSAIATTITDLSLDCARPSFLIMPFRASN